VYIRIFNTVNSKVRAIGESVFVDKLDAFREKQLSELIASRECLGTDTADAVRDLDYFEAGTE
jgi:hypothetical protein